MCYVIEKEALWENMLGKHIIGFVLYVIKTLRQNMPVKIFVHGLVDNKQIEIEQEL